MSTPLSVYDYKGSVPNLQGEDVFFKFNDPCQEKYAWDRLLRKRKRIFDSYKQEVHVFKELLGMYKEDQKDFLLPEYDDEEFTIPVDYDPS